MRIGSVLTHSGEALFEGLLIGLMVVVLMAGTAFAARGSGGGGGGHKGGSTVAGGTLAIKMVTDADGSGSVTWGDTVTYDVSKVTVSNPYITTTCTQGGTMVLSTWAGYYDGYMWPAARNIRLSSDMWTGGAASCTGVLYGTSTKLTFSVGS
jgi:hypothetical protein